MLDKKNLEISWFGLDGFLVVLYFVFVAIIYYAITARNDFIVGVVIPYGLMITVTLIFLNYLSIVFKFSRGKGRESDGGQKSDCAGE
ncbi:hypothetical protein [Sporomusa acidovorans]|uniref:Uncharacterized protein n=1 Tax=Sporomusa acidovorans (strain ATCC 49682 / DSM 3132 / Mol) TaxID=1123286 RepID=A0ABZ3J9G7_SPOA4|nr:hypothetical protein [Sporomusa acidovorans]OZC16085.1 hypothetical protein SPACI_44520 [Sporomusa acidovorans DSM 3132]SDD87172.1 hypothetical protein SAMN04488499_100544 [Sporomusa acidovorans]